MPNRPSKPTGTREHGNTGTREHGNTGTREHGNTGTREHGKWISNCLIRQVLKILNQKQRR